MNERDAAELIVDAVEAAGPSWADIGAGRGTFTGALRSLLPAGSRIFAIDNDPESITQLQALGHGVVPVQADFSRDVALPGHVHFVDGILLANALHFVRDAEGTLRRLVNLLRPGGRAVIVEYDHRAATPWVPYPIRSDQWPGLAHAAGLTYARITARTPSVYSGELYVGAADRPT